MNGLSRTAVAGAAALGLGLAGTATAGTPDATPRVVNRETVAAELSTTGTLDVARLISQLTVTGKGTVTLADPLSTKNLRNLDGFAAPSVRDGKALYTITVDGTANRRTVSDFTKPLPLTVSAEYTFNGRRVRPADVVGKTGDLSVRYVVKNVTGTPTTVTWKDGKGVQRSETVDLVTPMVGQLQTTLPRGFSQLDAPRADVAGDGRGGNVLTYTMVLFEPIGAVTQEFGWSGHVKNARIPAVEVQAVPVPPSRKPELKFGEDGFKEGASQATELTDGAGQIDANLLKLQSGASDLLAGLTKLAAGAVDLRNGLTDQLAPGASKLAAGAKDAKAGSADLRAGLGDLSAGASAVSGGLGDAKAGSAELADGLAQISDGLAALAAADGLPAAKAGALALLQGVAALRAGIGAPGQTGTVLDGLAQLATGLTTVRGGLDALASSSTGLPAAKGGVDAVKAGLDAATASGGALDTFIAMATADGDLLLAGGLQQLKTQTQAAGAGLGQVSAGLAAAVAGVGQLQAGVGDAATTGTLRNGVARLQVGVGQIAAGLKSGDPANPGIYEGLQALVAGLTAAVDGVVALNAGAADAAAGASDLDAGLGLLADGSAALADGADQAAAGAGQLDDGLGAISDGATQLSSGATDAANGSQQLADGLAQAKTGNGQIVAGAGQLRSEGTSKLVSAGNDTASHNAERYARMVALNEKARDGALPYGAPEGATGSAVYSLTLAAATSESHDNTTRSLVAALVLLAALAVSWFLRRRVAVR